MPEKKQQQRLKGARERDAAEDQAAGVSVRMSKDLRQRAKVYAAQNDRSLMAVVDEAVADFLKKRGAA